MARLHPEWEEESEGGLRRTLADVQCVEFGASVEPNSRPEAAGLFLRKWFSRTGNLFRRVGRGELSSPLSLLPHNLQTNTPTEY